MVAELTNCPIALVSFVEAEKQWFKSRIGMLHARRQVTTLIFLQGSMQLRPLVAFHFAHTRFTLLASFS